MTENDERGGVSGKVIGNIRFNGTGFYGDNGTLSSLVRDGVLTSEQIDVAQSEYMEREARSALFMVRVTGLPFVNKSGYYRRFLEYGEREGLITPGDIVSADAEYSGKPVRGIL